MTTGTKSTIHSRRVVFDWERTPLHWVPGDAQTTHTINVLHLLLPAGERWFVKVYKQALDDIRDAELLEDVKGFMAQESWHSRAHATVLDHLASQGIDSTPYTRRVEWMFDRLLGDNPLRLRGIPRRLKRRWLLRRLGIIAAVEHFTAVLGVWVLDSPALDRAGADPVMLDLLRWHGAEEVEHRHVAFDLFKHAGGTYFGGVLAMVVTAPVLAYLWFQGVRFFMHADPTTTREPTWREFRRAGRRGLVPTASLLLAAVPRYLRRDYHPSREGSTERALAYLAESPAANAYGAA
jgi:predicted metal-dependent hydrolase